MIERGDNWSLEYDDGVVIGRFEHGMPLSAFETEAYPAFERILEHHRDDIVATADVVRHPETRAQAPAPRARGGDRDVRGPTAGDTLGPHWRAVIQSTHWGAVTQSR